MTFRDFLSSHLRIVLRLRQHYHKVIIERSAYLLTFIVAQGYHAFIALCSRRYHWIRIHLRTIGDKVVCTRLAVDFLQTCREHHSRVSLVIHAAELCFLDTLQLHTVTQGIMPRTITIFAVGHLSPTRHNKRLFLVTADAQELLLIATFPVKALPGEVPGL